VSAVVIQKNLLVKTTFLLVVIFLLLPSLHLSAQSKTISGSVKDEKGQPLSGVSVVVKETKAGTNTNASGQFNLTVPQTGTLVFSYIGYSPLEAPISDSLSYNITLQSGTGQLGEVIVVAYGSTTKKTTTGAIQTVNSKELQDIPAAQVTQKLQGKLAGVQINQTTGKPGQGMQVRIRGQASILAGSDPLYVVDGFPIVGDISNINPDEIESITVLKDAASTSLYGSRAANGVILIQTKGAKSGRTTIGVNAYYGFQEVPQKGRPDMMNGTEFAQFKKESYEDLGVDVPEAFQNPSQYGEGTDWYGGMLQKGPIQNYSISLSSGKDRFSTSATAGYFDQDGVMLNSNYKRYSLRINSEFKATDKIKVGLNAAPTYSINNTPSSDGAFYAAFIDPVRSGGLLYNAMLTWPIVPYKNEDGTLPLTAWIPGTGGFPTPNWYRSVQEITNTTKTSRLLANGYIEYEPVQGLTLKSSINVDLGNQQFNNFNPSTASTQFTALPPVTATALETSMQYSSWLWENTAVYKKSIKDHNFELLAGYTSQKYSSYMTQIRATGFPDDRIHTIQTALNIDRTATYDDTQKWSLLSYIGRLNYNYKGKYILTAALRRDGSSRFGTDNRWGNFPSVSAGWLVSDEGFMRNMKSLSFLKIRASYGVTGNNNIGNYTQYANVSTTTNAIFGNNVASGASVTSLSNADLGWETTKQVDAGIDVGLFNNRINFSYDFYTKTTSNLLYNVAVPQESGFSSFTGNIGELKFWGHEFTAGAKILTGEFKWNVDVNLSFNRNKVLALAPGIERIYSDANITMVGQPLGLFYGLIQEGVYVNQEDFDKSPKYVLSQVGTIKFKDVNGDGVITYGGDADDRTTMGNPWPDFLYGITSSFYYKNFDLTIVGSGSQGNDILRRTEQGTTNLDGVFNVLKDVKDRWRSPENPGSGKYGTTKYATFMERDFNNSRFVSDGSFFTIKNITLGYNLRLKNAKVINNLRVYASVQQAYVFTSYPGVNPEVSTDAIGAPTTALNQGNDWGTYPVPRTYTFGVNVGF